MAFILTEACTKDLLNSFKFLNVEGYMMIDDVRLDVYPNKLNVINAIKNFVDCYNNYIDIIFFGWNVIVIKKKRNRLLTVKFYMNFLANHLLELVFMVAEQILNLIQVILVVVVFPIQLTLDVLHQ